MTPVVKVTTYRLRKLAVDPGIRGSGAALFRGGQIVAAAYVKNPAKTGNRAAEVVSMARAISDWVITTPGGYLTTDELIVEWPQIYATQIRRGESKADPNDLLALAGVVSAVAAELRVPTTSYLPAEWKGQVKKDAHHLRIENRLSESEVKIIDAVRREAGAKAHNAIDAIGLGLHHLGRLERKRVVAF